MEEDNDVDLTVTVSSRKKSKIITKEDLKQEADKDAQLVKMFCKDLGSYYILKGNGFQEFIKNNIPNYTLPSMQKLSQELITKEDLKQEADKDAQLVKMFCKDLGSYYILKGNGFQEFIKNNIPNYTLPSMQKLSQELIPEQYNRARLCLLKTLESVHHIAISIDTWKLHEPDRRNAHIMGTATIHFVYQGRLIYRTLFTMAVNQRTAKSMASAIKKKLVEWGVLKKVVCFTTNHGKNENLLKKAIDVFNTAENTNGTHLFCAAAIINLAIVDTLTDLTFKELEKKYNTDNSDSLKLKNKVGPFSWHYWYIMLKNISENNAGNFNADERRIHGDCVSFLKPLEDFNNTLSSQQYVTLSSIIPLIADLKSKVSECSTVTAVAAEVKTKLMDSIGYISEKYVNEPIAAKATFMDPRYKNTYFTQEKADSVQQDIINDFIECVNSNSKSVPSASNKQTEEMIRAEVKHYVSQPILEERDAFKFWEEFDRFRKDSPVNFYIMAQKYLCIPATAIPVETISGEWKKHDPNNYNERRTSLEYIDVNKMLFLHSYYSRNKEI